MNNKGFAITGILYLLLIMFLLILVSSLNEIRAKNRLLEKGIEGMEEDYVGKKVTNDENLDTILSSIATAPYTGKYVFSYADESGVYECFAYLSKDSINNDGSINVSNITFIDTNENSENKCNNVKDKLTLNNISEIYSFDE